MFKKVPFNVFILGVVSFFNDVASEMIYPIIPLFLTSVLQVPVSLIGLIEGTAEATASLMKFISGYISDKSLPDYYRGAVALVVPSLWEGFCLPAVESMACGCPVIASTTGSLPEILGDAGMLVDPTDLSSLTTAMMKVATQPTVRNQMAKIGLEEMKRYDWDTFANIVYRIINSV